MKKKLSIITLISTLIIFTSLTVLVYANNTNDRDEFKVTDNFTIEYGNEISNNVADYVLDNTDEKVVKNTTVEIVGLDESSEYPSVGDYVVKVKYKNQVKEIIVTVEDTTKPVFKEIKSEVETFVNEKIDYSTLYKVEDLSGVNIEVDESNIDYSKAGTYELYIKAYDKYGNSSEEKVKIVIKEKETKVISANKETKKTEQNKTNTNSNAINTSNKVVRGIILKQSGFRKPTSNTFGNWLDYAETLYNALMNREDFFYEFDFSSKEECHQFQNLVYANIVPNGICLYDAYSHGYDIHKAETGNTFTEYHRVRYDYSWVKTKNTDIYQIESLAYNACVSAGLQNGMSETEAVKKISNWIANNMSYVKNDGDAYIGFTTKQGQCWTYAEMFNAMCGAASIESIEISGFANGGQHAWNKVKADGIWYYMDITWYDTGSNSNYLFSETIWTSHKIS